MQLVILLFWPNNKFNDFHFQNDFHSISTCFSVSVYMIQSQISFLYKSFWNEFIPNLKPIKILVLYDNNFILVSIMQSGNELCSEMKIANSVVLGGWHIHIIFNIATRDNKEIIFLCVVWSTNVILEQTSFCKEHHTAPKPWCCFPTFQWGLKKKIASLAFLQSRTFPFHHSYYCNFDLLFCFVSQKFNEYLDELTEHYDIPKVSWTKWLPSWCQCCTLPAVKAASLNSLTVQHLVFNIEK